MCKIEILCYLLTFLCFEWMMVHMLEKREIFPRICVKLCLIVPYTLSPVIDRLFSSDFLYGEKKIVQSLQLSHYLIVKIIEKWTKR